jgi:hypothetical protein
MKADIVIGTNQILKLKLFGVISKLLPASKHIKLEVHTCIV